MAARAAPPRRLPLRWHLFAIVVGTLLPVVAFAAVAVYMVESGDRSSNERRLLQSSHTLAAAVEREVAASVRTLQVMAESERLDGDDVTGFRTEAERALATQPTWRSVTLLAPNAQVLFDTEYSHGDDFPSAREPESVRRVISTERPAVGDLIEAERARVWAFPIRVPVLRAGTLHYILTAYITTQALMSIVGTEPFPDEWTRAVIDRQGTIVARSRSPERFIGQPARPDLLDRSQTSEEFILRATTRDDEDVYSAVSRIPSLEWTATVAVPLWFLDGPLRRSLFGLAGSGLLLLVGSTVGALFLSRRAARGIVAATSAAQALAHGERLPVPTTSIQEVGELGDALDRSATLLLQRERERDIHLARAEAASAEAETARAEAESANRAKDEFLAMLAHEIRNPLSPIVAAVELLRQKGEADNREFGIIRRQLHHLVRIVDDLLDVSRATQGKIDLRKAPVELSAAVARAREMAQPLIDQRKHEITIDVPQSGLLLEADPVRLAQALANLLINAAKYTPTGGVLRLLARRQGNEAFIEITDNGQGIDPELLPRVFDLFVQAPRALDRGQGGLGIGLTLVRSLIQLHGGRVEARSEGKNRGSTFTVWLPLLPSTAPEATALAASSAAPAASRLGRPLRILIVDDNVDAAELLGELFSADAHEIATVYDGPSALALLDRFVPDVAVLDIGLPVIDGFTLAGLIREKLGSAGPIFMAVTGYGQERDRARSRAAGFLRHFVKPVDPSALLAAVTELAGARPPAPA